MQSECDDFLDWGLCYSIHELIDSSNVEKFDPVVAKQFNLICAVIDRVQDALNYLNDHVDAPRTDQGVLLYLVYACMIVDAVKQMHEAFALEYPGADKDDQGNYKFFGKLIQGKPLFIPEESLPTDDKFFEHFRSLVFAHPFKTDRARFLDRAHKEIQYSPFVIHAHSPGAASGEEEMIGVRIYSSVRNDIVDFRFDFSILKGYVKSRYGFLSNVLDHVREIIESQKEEWRHHPINREQPPEKILQDMVAALKVRFVDGLAEDALRYYTTPLTPGYLDNESRVGEYRKLMREALPDWCDKLDALDHDGLYEAMEPLVVPRVPIVSEYSGVGYQLEKIFCHLGEENACGDWARRQLKAFASGFASEWVTILPDMPVDEAHLLVTAACYFEFNRYMCDHPDALRPDGFPIAPNGAGFRSVVIGDLQKEIKKL